MKRHPLCSPTPTPTPTRATVIAVVAAVAPPAHTHQHPQAAYPHMSRVYGQAVAATIPLFLMLLSATWLLMHAASQWGRTRAEAKLMARIPHAARVGAGGSNNGKGAGAAGSGGGGFDSGMLVADVPAKQQSAPLATV